VHVVCFSSNNTVRVNLGLLKPLWHLYLKLTSKHDPLDTGAKPPLMLALTELFYSVETAAEVWLLTVCVACCGLCDPYSAWSLTIY